MTTEELFLQAVADRNIVRVRVAGIVIQNGHLLVQKPTDDPDACYALIGGEYEVGDTFESRLRREFEEETNAKVIASRYLFVVETRFRFRGELIQSLEHYFDVDINRDDIESRESHLAQHWLPLSDLAAYDLRPHFVRDTIASGAYQTVRHLVGPEP